MTTERGRPYGADARVRYGPAVEEEARRQQALALTARLGALVVTLWRAGPALAALVGRMVRPITWRSRRRTAIADLHGLDARLLADIGLQRGDIELAVDGHLVDERFSHPRPAAPTQIRQLRPNLVPEAAANRNQTDLRHAS